MEKEKRKQFVKPEGNTIEFVDEDVILTSLINGGIGDEIGTDGEHFGG